MFQIKVEAIIIFLFEKKMKIFVWRLIKSNEDSNNRQNEKKMHITCRNVKIKEFN